MPSPSRVDLSEAVIGLQQQIRRLQESTPDLSADQHQLWSQSLQSLVQGIEGLRQLQADLDGGDRSGSFQAPLPIQNTSIWDLEELARERYRAILEIQEDIVCRYTPVGLLTYVNPALCAFHDQRPEFLLGTNWIVMLPPEAQAQVRQELAQLTPTHPIHRVEKSVRDGQGRVRWFEWIDHGLFDDTGRLVEIQSVGRERTEQKQVEEQLHQSQTLLEQSQSVGRMGSFVWHIQEQRLIWSLETYRLLGRDPETYHPSLANFIQQVHPEDQENYRARLQLAIEKYDSFQAEFRIIRPDGSILVVEDRAEIIRDELGAPIQMIGTMLDITERKRIEDRLHRSERWLRALIENLPCLIWAKDLDGVMSLQNSNCIQMWGHSIGKRMTHPEQGQKQRIWDEEDLRAASGEVVFSEDVANIDGQERYFHKVIAPLYNGDQIEGSIGASIDITDRKQMEEDLRRSEELFRAVFEQAAVGISQATIEGQFLKVNPKLCDLMGYTENELKGYRYFDLAHPEDVALGEEQFQQLMRDEIPSYSVEKRFYCKGGQIRWLNVTVFLIRDRQNQPLFEIAVIEDITERKQLTQQKDEFISTVSHELRTPLTSIQALLGLLTIGRLGSLTEPGQQLLRAAKTDTDRLQRLVNDLLNLERLKADRVRIRKELFSIDILVAQVLQMMTPLATEAEILLESQIQTPITWGDPDQIMQVLTNLIDNAIKFSPSGSTISVSVTHQQNHTLWQITDQGIGISPDRLQIIFEPFQQGDPADDRPHSGSGLGLALCEQIIRQHQGQIWAEHLPQGSLFSFTLPHAPDQPMISSTHSLSLQDQV